MNKMNNVETIVDLFAGCGGMSLGFMKEGFNVIAGYENWKEAATTYRNNFEHPLHEEDLGNPNVIKSIKEYEPDITTEELQV